MFKYFDETLIPWLELSPHYVAESYWRPYGLDSIIGSDEPCLFETPFEAVSKTLYISTYISFVYFIKLCSNLETIVVPYYQFNFIWLVLHPTWSSICKMGFYHFDLLSKWMHASRVLLWYSFLKGNNTLSVATVLILGYSNILKWQPRWFYTFGYLLTSPYLCPFCDFMTNSL